MASFNEIKVGDKFAMRNRSSSYSAMGVDYSIRTVDRVTDTTFVSGVLRVRKSDGKVIGENYRHAQVATPELLAEHARQQDAAKAYFAAKSRLEAAKNALSWNQLTTDQMNTLADAYEAILP